MPSDKVPTELTSASQESIDSDIPLVRHQYGIWELVLVRNHGVDIHGKWKKVKEGGEVYWRLLNEVYTTSPGLTGLYILTQFWGSVEEAVLLHSSSDLLRLIESGMRSEMFDREAIQRAVLQRVACSILIAGFKWWVGTIKPVIKSRVRSHYEIELMRARMRLSLSSVSEDPMTGTGSVSAGTPWDAFETAIGFACSIVTFISQCVLLFYAARSGGGPMFAFLAVIQPVYQAITVPDIWAQHALIILKNKFYRRMKALKRLTAAEYKHEYIAGDMSNYLLKEYELAYKNLGKTSTDEIWSQMEQPRTPYRSVSGAVLGDLPIMYCAWVAITDPHKLSLTSVAILQQSTNTIRWSMESAMNTVALFQRHVSKLKKIYSTLEIKPSVKEGEVAYPRRDLVIEKTVAEGMGIQLRNITFDYPSSQSTTSALKGITLTIKPGSLVVIIGANGSGKSTLIKLLTRMYEATSGTLHIDGLPASEYRAADLRQTIASFSQDHKLYPLSLYENIGLGNHTQVHDRAQVLKAAELGGAAGFISKLEAGLDSFLDPMNDFYLMNVDGGDERHPLTKEMKKIQKEVDISGGERQRVVASRTFMHINSGKVKLVAVDEPSSALDPEAELTLFERLIEAREGKTMVFVTHRFGHLTKYADMIVCMKEGEIVESGSHRELMKLEGEYAKLYNIQAEAFADGTLRKT